MNNADATLNSTSDTEQAPEPPMFEDDWDYPDEEEDTTCPNCGGTGGEPYDDYITPCEDCDGEGYKWWL